MNYTQENIRNLLISGHGGSGKTSLVEALVYYTKGTDRLGRTDDGNTVCDFDPEEIRRKASLSLALASAEYSDTKLNLIDVPGLFDFELGIHEGMPGCRRRRDLRLRPRRAGGRQQKGLQAGPQIQQAHHVLRLQDRRRERRFL